MTTLVETKKLIAFHGDPAIKKKYLDRLEAHKAADEIIKGIYWQDGKGCAVGCTIHGGRHSAYEDELGIPRVLAKLEDGIFESLENGRAKDWPIQFLSAIEVGADLSNVWPQFAVWMLVDEQWGILQFAKTDQQRDVIELVAGFYRAGKYAKPEYYDEIRKIREEAYRCRDAYDAAYAYASYASAASAASASSAAAAASAASAEACASNAAAASAEACASNAAAAASAYAYDAAAAADAAYAYAEAYAYAAAYAYDAAYASYASAASACDAEARQKWRIAQSEKLLELMKAAPV